MGGLIAGVLVYLLYNVLLNPILALVGNVLAAIQSESLVMASMPWVTDAAQVSAAFAGSLLALNIGYRAMTNYVLWNEGTPGDGGLLVKGAFRAALYGAGSGALAYYTFRYGIWLGAAFVATPVHNAFHGVAALVADAFAASGVDELLLGLLFLVIVVALLVVVVQMAIRGFELALYIVAAPLAALGWMSASGGTWDNWWRGVVVLSLSFSVQMLALYGTVQVVMAQPADPFLAGLEMLAGVIVTIRGPHLVQQWSYHTGLGGALMGQVGTASAQGVRQVVTKVVK